MAGTELNVLVIAVGGNVSQGILKCLARSSLKCRVVGADISPPQLGLYTVDKAYVGPWANDPGFCEWLLRVCRDEHIDAVLSGAELVLKTLSRRKQEIESETGAVCLVSGPEIMAIGDDKLATCRWLEDAGMNCPRYAASEDLPALDALRKACGYPLIAKPRDAGGARGLLDVCSDNDLEYVARKAGYIVQECLGNPDTEYTAGCFVARDGSLRGACVMRRELLCGTTYRAVLGAFPEVRAEAERIAAALRPLGPCNIQLRMTPRGPVCFEINPRFSGTGPIRAYYGFNEVEAALRHFVLGEADIVLTCAMEGVALRYWNEMYVAPEALTTMAADGVLDTPRRFLRDVETYGVDNA